MDPGMDLYNEWFLLPQPEKYSETPQLLPPDGIQVNAPIERRTTDLFDLRAEDIYGGDLSRYLPSSVDNINIEEPIGNVEPLAIPIPNPVEAITNTPQQGSSSSNITTGDLTLFVPDFFAPEDAIFPTPTLVEQQPPKRLELIAVATPTCNIVQATASAVHTAGTSKPITRQPAPGITKRKTTANGRKTKKSRPDAQKQTDNSTKAPKKDRGRLYQRNYRDRMKVKESQIATELQLTRLQNVSYRQQLLAAGITPTVDPAVPVTKCDLVVTQRLFDYERMAELSGPFAEVYKILSEAASAHPGKILKLVADIDDM